MLRYHGWCRWGRVQDDGEWKSRVTSLSRLVDPCPRSKIELISTGCGRRSGKRTGIAVQSIASQSRDTQSGRKCTADFVRCSGCGCTGNRKHDRERLPDRPRNGRCRSRLKLCRACQRMIATHRGRGKRTAQQRANRARPSELRGDGCAEERCPLQQNREQRHGQMHPAERQPKKNGRDHRIGQLHPQPLPPTPRPPVDASREKFMCSVIAIASGSRSARME